MKPFLIFAAMAPLLVTVEPLGAQDLAVDGAYRIVIAEDRTKAEEYAAAQLKEYLRKITGKTLSIVPEADPAAGPAIYVGPTRFAAAGGMKDYGKEPAQQNSWVNSGSGRSPSVWNKAISMVS